MQTMYICVTSESHMVTWWLQFLINAALFCVCLLLEHIKEHLSPSSAETSTDTIEVSVTKAK